MNNVTDVWPEIEAKLSVAIPKWLRDATGRKFMDEFRDPDNPWHSVADPTQGFVTFAVDELWLFAEGMKYAAGAQNDAISTVSKQHHCSSAKRKYYPKHYSKSFGKAQDLYLFVQTERTRAMWEREFEGGNTLEPSWPTLHKRFVQAIDSLNGGPKYPDPPPTPHAMKVSYHEARKLFESINTTQWRAETFLSIIAGGSYTGETDCRIAYAISTDPKHAESSDHISQENTTDLLNRAVDHICRAMTTPEETADDPATVSEEVP